MPKSEAFVNLERVQELLILLNRTIEMHLAQQENYSKKKGIRLAAKNSEQVLEVLENSFLFLTNDAGHNEWD